MSHRAFRMIAVALVVAVAVVGTSQILAKKPPKTCPSPNPDCMCPWYEDTVYCKKPGKKSPICSYTNPCFARCAGFRDDQCSRGIPY